MTHSFGAEFTNCHTQLAVTAVGKRTHACRNHRSVREAHCGQKRYHDRPEAGGYDDRRRLCARFQRCLKFSIEITVSKEWNLSPPAPCGPGKESRNGACPPTVPGINATSQPPWLKYVENSQQQQR